MQFLNDLISDCIILIRPLLGSLNCCKFTISCTDFAVIELRKSSQLGKAIKSIFFRLISCCF